MEVLSDHPKLIMSTVVLNTRWRMLVGLLCAMCFRETVHCAIFCYSFGSMGPITHALMHWIPIFCVLAMMVLQCWMLRVIILRMEHRENDRSRLFTILYFTFILTFLFLAYIKYKNVGEVFAESQQTSLLFMLLSPALVVGAISYDRLSFGPLGRKMKNAHLVASLFFASCVMFTSIEIVREARTDWIVDTFALAIFMTMHVDNLLYMRDAASSIETVLSEREKLREHVYDSLNAAIWTLDSNLIFRSLGGRQDLIKKLKDTKMVGKHWDELQLVSSPENMNYSRSIHQHVLQTGQESAYTLHLVNDRETVLDVKVAPIRDSKDSTKIIGTISVAIDVTEQTAAQKLLQQQEHLYRTLVHSITDSVIQVDKSLSITFLNKWPILSPQASDVERQVLGKNLLRTMWSNACEQDQQHLHEIISQVFEKGQAAEFGWSKGIGSSDVVTLEKDPIVRPQLDLGSGSQPDEKRVFFTRVSPIVSENQPPSLAIVSSSDITAQYIAAEMAKAAAELELAARTKSALLLEISHETKNPLQAVLGSLELLMLSSRLDEQQVKQLEVCRQNVTLLIEIMQSVLHAEKLGSGHIQLHTEPTNIVNLVELSIDLMSTSAFARNLEVFSFVDPHLPLMLEIDRLRIQQVLTNLLSNAVKFTQSGYIKLSVHLVSETEEKVTIRFDCEDTGCGISESDLTRVFTLYWQGSELRQQQPTEYAGFGIGLQLCQKIMQSMNGDIRVESQVGKGSKFMVTVDLRKDSSSSQQRVYEMFPSRAEYSSVVIGCACAQLGQTIASYLQTAKLDTILTLTQHDKDKQSIIDQVRSHGQKFGPKVLVLLDEFFVEEPKALVELIPQLAQKSTIFILSDPFKSAATRSLDSGEAAESTSVVPGVTSRVQKPLSLNRLVDMLQPIEVKPQVHQHVPKPPLLHIDTSQIDVNKDVLVVEDSFINQRLLRNLLEKMGFKDVAVANDGKQAIDIIQKHCPARIYQLIFMDLMMPVLDGWQATAIIRRMEQEAKSTTRTRIVAVTALGDEEDVRKKLMESGFDAILTKPYTSKQLEEIIRIVERQQPPSEQSAKSPA